ncbi:MAG: septum formation protein Maf [Clostridiales bacterium]|nr:septum formation protein Maf [Clostridiales bacterium]
MEIILASNSSRRKNLLTMLNVPFSVMESGVDERVEEANYMQKGVEHTPYEWVRAIAAIKAEAVGNRVEGEKIIIAADTIVTYMGKILHRPFKREEAASMLRTLSGHKHTVYTGLAVMYKDADGKYETHTSVTATDVYMRELTDTEISNYVDTKEPYDKAGGYGIQGKGSLLIDHIDGDYFNVVGLPLVQLYKELSENGVNIMDFWK